MADIDRNAELHNAYGTASHIDGAAFTQTLPASQMRWQDFHPGKRILPPGSPPTSDPNEINWEDTLGGRFHKALKQLEGIMYAMWGSRPGAFDNGSGGYHKCQWYDRRHPRCLWGPEVWKQKVIIGPIGCTGGDTCWEYDTYEYAATGAIPPGTGWTLPSVPVKSRSGDPEAQYRDESRGHDRDYFPLGSVTREHTGGHHDPEGAGKFGASQPGRTDSPPWLTAANGYTIKAGDGVKISFDESVAGVSADSVTLFYAIDLAGGGSWIGVSMFKNGSVWEATIPPQDHGLTCHWYIRYNEVGPPPVEVYEPGGASEPGEPYSFVFFTHYVEYPSGFPELLDKADGGADPRHSTDVHEFTPDESIQPAIINMARFCLGFITGHTCELYGKNIGCESPIFHGSSAHHSPRLRSGVECCIPWTIRWLWSGSHRWPFYRADGKDGTRPLHDRDTEIGTQSLRKSWRGNWGMFFEHDFHFLNIDWDTGVSWGTFPAELPIYHKPTHPDGDPADVWWLYKEQGLRDNDVIDSVHIEEIIDAVEYLVSHGVWTTEVICSRQRTISSFKGRNCGTSTRRDINSCGISFNCTVDHEVGCGQCCDRQADPCSGGSCSTWAGACGSRSIYSGSPSDICRDGDDVGSVDPCTPHPVPDWTDCFETNCGQAKCRLVAERWGFCQFYGDPGYPDAPCSDRFHEESVMCNGCGQDGILCIDSSRGGTGGGAHSNQRGCRTYDWDDCDDNGVCNCTTAPDEGNACYRRTDGLAYWACTPPKDDYRSWDDRHGNPYTKTRMDHVWHPELFFVATGPPGNERSGNPLGDIYGCGSIFDPSGGVNFWFQQVFGVIWDGLGDPWFTDCTTDPGCGTPCTKSLSWAIDLPSAIPGLGYCTDPLGDCPTGNDMCYVFEGSNGFSNCFSTLALGGLCCDGHDCDFGISFEVCNGERAWVAVNLNLDDSGRAYYNFNGRDGGNPPYTGAGIPVLLDYDLTQDPDTWMHDCPCETRERPADCVIGGP